MWKVLDLFAVRGQDSFAGTVQNSNLEGVQDSFVGKNQDSFAGTNQNSNLEVVQDSFVGRGQSLTAVGILS